MNKHQRETDMIVIQLPRSDWEDIIDAVSYAAEDRQYQCECTTDPEDKETIEACAERWSDLASFLAELI